MVLPKNFGYSLLVVVDVHDGKNTQYGLFSKNQFLKESRQGLNSRLAYLMAFVVDGEHYRISVDWC